MAKKKRKIRWGIIIPVILLLLGVGGFFGFKAYQAYQEEQARIEAEKKREILYVASADKTEEAQLRSSVEQVTEEAEETEEAEPTVTLPRGTKVQVRVLPLVIKENESDEEGKEYRIVYIDDVEYLMTDEQLCHDLKDCVKETSAYVSLPTVLYKDASGPAIAGLTEKNTEVEITGFANLLPDGSVDRYQVNAEGNAGYIRSEYLVSSADQVVDTVPEVHRDRDDVYGGGDAGSLEYPVLDKGNFPDNPMPAEVRTLYLNKACIDSIDDYIEIAESSGINAFIIDIKESDGPAYQSPVIQQYSPSSYSAAFNSFDAYKAAVQKCKDKGIYVIGRIVTFKDDLYAEDHPEYCLVDRGSGSPYMLASAYWPSPYQRTVWEYNIRLAIEAAEEMGFNEINFDYIRFPDMIDLEIDNIDFRNDYDETMAQAINRYMFYARDELHERGVYFSCDVFGETSNDYVTAYGQYWPMMSNIADVMCAMPYPDHFDIHDYGIAQAVWEVPYDLLYYWGSYVVDRQDETPSPAKVRTWLQGFDTTYKEPEVMYGVDKIIEQIEGLYANGLDDGYMVWNAPSELYRYWAYVDAFEPRTGD